MGQVFSWEQVRTGNVPAPNGFKSVSSVIRTVLESESAIECALLFGSSVRGDSNRRSDIDCVVLYRLDAERPAMQTLQRLDTMAKSLLVPLNWTPCDTELAKTRLHHLGESLTQHLSQSIEAGGLIKGDLLGALAAATPLKAEIESYLSHKMYNLVEAYAQKATMSLERRLNFYKKTLEAPMHVARKVLRYYELLTDDAKHSVLARYQETMAPELARLLKDLVDFDSSYTAEVERQLITPDQHRYHAMLEDIDNNTPRVLEFLRGNIIRLA